MDDKIDRVLSIYTKLINGHVVNRAQEAAAYGVHVRSIQRDINDIRSFLEVDGADSGQSGSIVYDREKKGYLLKQESQNKLTNSEILAVCKILLDSRALIKREMENLLRKMVACCVPQNNQKVIWNLISNELFHYVEPRHGAQFLDTMWDIGQAIQKNRYIEIDYFRTKDKSVVKRKLRPAAIMFSEYYFYLAAFIDDEDIRKDFNVIDDSFPTIYRMDRIKKLIILKEQFHVPYRDRFEEGEFRKRIQFMYGGRLRRVKFRYCGTDIGAILDRLPTAQILSEEDGIYTVSAEVFGDGIDMWLRSQGDLVEEIIE